MSSKQAKINKIKMEDYYDDEEASKSIQRRAAEGK
jgi:hypothetical protein